MRSNLTRVVLSDEVAEAVRQAKDANEAFAILNTATDFYLETQREMTLQEALARIALVARYVEGIEYSAANGT